MNGALRERIGWRSRDNGSKPSAMFSWLKKKPAPMTDCVWMTDEARVAGIVRSDPKLVIAFFEASRARYAALLPNAKVLLVDQIKPAFDKAQEGPEVCVVEHHPLPSQNDRLLEKLVGLSPHTPTFHVALDEPIMRLFGGDRVLAMMQQLGMKPDEWVTHPLVSKSLDNARHKLPAKVSMELQASSMEEWFARNVAEKI